MPEKPYSVEEINRGVPTRPVDRDEVRKAVEADQEQARKEAQDAAKKVGKAQG